MYPAGAIPDKLLHHAGAVIRTAQYKYTLISEKKARLDVKVAVTLLNETADDLHVIGLPYDPFRRISGLTARAYNAEGQLIWNLRKFNIADQSGFTGPEALSDTRIKVFEVPSFSYPFTIEYAYAMHMEDLFLSPARFLQPVSGMSVQEAGVVFIIPGELDFKYLTRNMLSPCDSVVRGNKRYLSWKETMLPARDASSNPLDRNIPVVYAAPVQFELKGYTGSLHTWNDFGKWIAALNKGLDELDPASVRKAHTLVENCTSRDDSIRVLYEYLQQHTHYFYTGYGIGGTRPIPATEVATYGYGDCKALSNYMKALLKAVGIESWYTLVKSGPGESIETDFPGSQFDHVILCVPGSDTVWLECTNPSLPYGFPGSFTCDRDVLAITPEGGKILHTPVYGPSQNQLSTRAVIQLDTLGNARANITLKGSALWFEELHALSEMKPEERRKIWTAWTGCPTGVISEGYTFGGDRLPEATVQLELQLYNLVPVSKGRLYVSQSLLSDPPEGPAGKFAYAFRQVDSLFVELPCTAGIEDMPDVRSDYSDSGNQQLIFVNDRQQLIITRNREYLHPETDKLKDALLDSQPVVISIR